MMSGPRNEPPRGEVFGSDEVTAGAATDNVAAIRAAATAVRIGQSESRAAESLTAGRAVPASNTTYWDRREILVVDEREGPGRRPLPRWFLTCSILTVVTAVTLVLIILYVTSGSSS